MLRKLFVALALSAVLGSISQAQDVTPINGTKKAWIIRYGTEINSGNKRKDLAIVLKLRAGQGDKKFTGTLLRFDIARNSKYLRAVGNTGKIAISGQFTEIGSGGSARRPVRLTGAGTYVTAEGKVRIVVLKGMYHPGNDTTSRDDDRLTAHIQIKNVSTNGNADAPAAGGDAETVDVSNEIFVVFQENPPPCDDEPDTDVLMEETLTVADDQIDDLEELPTDP